MRINHAKALILNSPWKMSKIGESVGFPDEYYFSRSLKSIRENRPQNMPGKAEREKKREMTECVISVFDSVGTAYGQQMKFQTAVIPVKFFHKLGERMALQAAARIMMVQVFLELCRIIVRQMEKIRLRILKNSVTEKTYEKLLLSLVTIRSDW